MQNATNTSTKHKNEIRRLTAVEQGLELLGIFLQLGSVLPKPRIVGRGVLRMDARPDVVLLALGRREFQHRLDHIGLLDELMLAGLAQANVQLVAHSVLFGSAVMQQRPAARQCGAAFRSSEGARPLASPARLCWDTHCATFDRFVDECGILSQSLHLAKYLVSSMLIRQGKRRRKKENGESRLIKLIN
jgi:hypothetical protein